MSRVIFFLDAISKLMNTRVYSDLVETLEKGRGEREIIPRALFAKFPVEILFSYVSRNSRLDCMSSRFVWRSLKRLELKKLRLVSAVEATGDFNNSRGDRGPGKTESERKNRSKCDEAGIEEIKS